MSLTQVAQSLIIPTTPVYGPAFSVYTAVNQSVSSGVATKVNLATEAFDTDGCFNVATSRFLPTQPGYYMFTGRILTNATTSNTLCVAMLYKNGSMVMSGPIFYGTGTNNLSCSVNGLVYLDGVTDYVELWGNETGSGTNTFQSGATNTYFTGFQARPA